MKNEHTMTHTTGCWDDRLLSFHSVSRMTGTLFNNFIYCTYLLDKLMLLGCTNITPHNPFLKVFTVSYQ